MYVIDYGLGNINSIINMVNYCGGSIGIIDDPLYLKKNSIEKLILPGVGSFDTAMKLLKAKGWVNTLNDFINNDKNKILGICLGMQLMFENSEEGILPGLGWIRGDVKKFKFKDNKFKVPHMGWNTIKTKKRNYLIHNDNEQKRFYFVHSYYVNCKDENDIAAVSNHDFNFTCAVEKNNIFGVQFHPEKSHRFGIELFKKFIKI